MKCSDCGGIAYQCPCWEPRRDLNERFKMPINSLQPPPEIDALRAVPPQAAPGASSKENA